MKTTYTLPVYPAELPLIVDADAEGNVVTVRFRGTDITSACIADPTLWGELQTYADEALHDALQEVEAERREARQWMFV